jgi:hypothetical protein
MFGWFRSKPACPVDLATREWIDKRWDWLVTQFGLERLRKTAVVLPRPEYFPDPYHGSDEDVRRILDRVCGYMDIDPATVELSLYEDEEGKVIFEAECRLRTFAGAVLSESQRLLEKYGREGYLGLWDQHEFPLEKQERLRQLLRQGPRSQRTRC